MDGLVLRINGMHYNICQRGERITNRRKVLADSCAGCVRRAGKEWYTGTDTDTVRPFDDLYLFVDYWRLSGPDLRKGKPGICPARQK